MMGTRLAKETPQVWWIKTEKTNQVIINPWDLRNGRPFTPQHQFDGYLEMLNYFPDRGYPVMDYPAMFQIMQKSAYAGWLKMYGGDLIDTLSSVRIDDLRTWLNIHLKEGTPLQVQLPTVPKGNNPESREPIYLYYHPKHGGYLAYRIFYHPEDYNWLVSHLLQGRVDDPGDIKSFAEELSEKGIHLSGQPTIDPDNPYKISFQVKFEN